ncbi:ergothioneine biosynthesis protein EgtC [Parasphingorhabdus pacifica]
MCRHVGYAGPPVALDELLLEPAHSLLEQSWAPRDMRSGGTVNADGFGAGWYLSGTAEPIRYRAAVPMWTDRAFAAFASSIHARAVLAAVRSATVGMCVTEGACAPFSDGKWLFSHNGKVPGWPNSLAKAAAGLDVVDLMTLDAPTDSAVLWALLRQRLDTGEDPATAVTRLVEEVVTAVPSARMNLLLTDGTLLVATTWAHSLWLRRDSDSVTIASEPFGTGPGWQEIPDRRLVVADARQVRITALEEGDKS